MKRLLNDSDAILSGDGRYRYTLVRRWDPAKSAVLFVMLNPSTADATKNDATIRRCLGYAKAWGFGELRVANLFAYRATNPTDLIRVEDPIGPENDRHIWALAIGAYRVVVAWGPNGSWKGRDTEVVHMLRAFDLQALKLCKDGAPAHPLRLAKNLSPFPYNPGGLRL